MKTYDYGEDSAAVEGRHLAQRKKLAELLMSQSVNGGPIYSNKAGIARALTGLIAGMDMGQAERGEKDLAQRRESERRAEMERIVGAAESPEGSPLRAQFAKLLATSNNPTYAQAGLAMLMKGPGKLEWKDAGDRMVGLDETGRIVREMPKGVSPDTRFNRTTVSADTALTHGTPSAGAVLSSETTRAEGAANRGVQVRGQNLTNSRAVDANAVAAGTKSREDLDSLRKEFHALPVVKTFNEVRPIVESARKAPDTKQGDFALIYGVGKVLDPNSVVREGEMGLVIASGSPAQRVGGFLAQLQGKGRLTPDMRKELMVVLDQRAGEYEKGYGAARQTYEGIAKQRGYDSSQVFMDVGGGGATPRVSSDADYAALPSGSTFIDPDGKTRRKP